MASVIKRPFWIHQLVEYILGLALVSLGLQSPEPEVPAVVGLLVVANASIVRRSPLSAFRLVDRAVHRWLDVVVMAVLVVAAVQPWFDTVPADRVTIGGVAFIMGFVWWRSSFAEKPRRTVMATPTPAEPVAPVAAPTEPSGTTDRSTQLGRTAGRAVGQGLGAARRLGKRTGR